jgi:hypothetical protein
VRIELEDSVDVPTMDVGHLAEHLIRFQFAEPQPVSPYHQALLEGEATGRSILPDAPNREGIEHNYRQLRDQIEGVFTAHQSSLAFTLADVKSLADFVRLNIDHHCRPRYLYTNGQTAMTLALRGERCLEVAPHPSMEQLRGFGSVYGPWHLIDPAEIKLFSGLAAAETWIKARLSELSVQALPMLRGEQERTLLLQEAGFRRDEKGYPIQTYLAHFEGRITKLQIGPEEPYEFLNRLVLDDFRVKSCATCKNFRFSGMSRDMSHGSSGYCSPRRTEAAASGLPRRGLDTTPSSSPVVSVFSGCGDYEFIEDAARPFPYLRAGPVTTG